MIRFIKGVVEGIGEQHVLIEQQGIGYRIWTSAFSIEELKGRSETVKLFTHLHVREDAMILYGFAAEEELQMFETLTSVSKIGPKAALNILSALKPIDIRMAILTNDIKLLSKVNGIGAKTAERLVLELKDKIEDVKLWELNQIPDKSNAKIMEEAVLALVGLGYSKSQAESAVKQVEAEDLESYIKLALKKLF